MRNRMLYTALLVIACASLVSALELNFGGDYTRIPTVSSVAPTATEKALRFSLRSQLYNTSLSGDANRSYKDDELRYANLLSAAYDHPFAGDDQQLRITADLKNSNDDRLQEDPLELLGLLVDYRRGEQHQLQAGDIYLYGGQYTYRRNVRGAGYRYTGSLAGGGLEVRSGYGRLLEAMEGFQYRRMLFGSSVRWQKETGNDLLQSYALAVDYANAADAEDSIDNAPGFGALTNNVFGFNLDLRFKAQANLRAEFASSTLDIKGTDTSPSGSAYSLAFDKRFTLGSLNLGWEDVQDEFRSLAGSGNPDSRRLYGAFRTRIGTRYTLTTGFNRSSNGLGGRTFTTTTPNLLLSVRPFVDGDRHPALQRMRLSLNLSRPSYEADDNTLERSIFSHRWMLATALKEWQLGLSYSGQSTTDDLLPANDRDQDGLSLNLSHPSLVDTRNLTGDFGFTFNRNADGLSDAPDRNKRTYLRLRSAGRLFQFLYACGLGFNSVDLVADALDYTRTTWDISLSRRLTRFRDLSLGLALQGSHRSADNAAGDLREITSRLQLQTTF